MAKALTQVQNDALLKLPKIRVSWVGQRRRWEVWEDWPRQIIHHSFHRTEKEAQAAARAQRAWDRCDAIAKANKSL